MTRMKSGAVALLSAGLFLSCSNPTSDLETGPARLLVTPQFAVIDSGSTATAFLQVLDEQGNPLNTSVTFTSTPTVGVAVDPAYRPNATQKYGRQYIVTGLTANTGRVIFTAEGGEADTFDIFIAPPGNLGGATVSDAAPAIGTLVTATVPAGGYEFTPASVVTVPGASVFTVAPAANSTTIDFYVGSGGNGPVTVSNVQPTYAPLNPVNAVTVAPLTTPPALAGATVSSAAPGTGNLVTATAPPGGYQFTPASVVSVAGTQVVTVAPLANSNTIDFYVGPAGNGPVTVSGVAATFVALTGITTATAATLTTPAIGNPTLSSTNPAVGANVVLTAPAPFVFTSATLVTVPGTQNAIVGLSPDSTQLTFRTGPGATGGNVTANNLVVEGVPAPGLGPYAVVTTQSLTTGQVTSIPAAYSTTTPNTNDLVTVTAPGFIFRPQVSVRFNNAVQAVTSVAADGSSFTFRAASAGASGTIRIAAAALDFIPTVALGSVPTGANNEVTVAATVTALTGTDATATAPAVGVPATGQTSILNDDGTMAGSGDCLGSPGGFNCRVYRLTTAAAQTVLVTANWSNTTDLGIYFTDAGGNDIAPGFVCDGHGNGATAHPESCTVDLPAGDNYMFVTTFGPLYPTNDPDPATINIVIDGQ